MSLKNARKGIHFWKDRSFKIHECSVPFAQINYIFHTKTRRPKVTNICMHRFFLFSQNRSLTRQKDQQALSVNMAS